MASNTVKADMLYDPIENEWELGSSNDAMYNGFDNEWSYEPKDLNWSTTHLSILGDIHSTVIKLLSMNLKIQFLSSQAL